MHLIRYHNGKKQKIEDPHPVAFESLLLGQLGTDEDFPSLIVARFEGVSLVFDGTTTPHLYLLLFDS